MRRLEFIVMLLVLGLFLCLPPARAEIPPGTEEVLGEHEGALYALYLPPAWNSDLVLYAHGYADPAWPVALPDGFSDTRDGLLELGFAVAYSSYSANGYAVKEGFKETRQLPFIFSWHFTRPEHIYVMGHSMGGLIAAMLAERYPNQITGVVPMCGQVGGSQMAVDYVWNLRALFDYYYPGALPGNAMEIPEGTDCYGSEYWDAIYANPEPLYELAGVDQVEVPYESFDELAWSVGYSLWFHCVGCNELLERTHDRVFFDNADIYYTDSDDDEALNAGMDRFAGQPLGHFYLWRWYQTKGRLNIPALTLHTSRDGLVHPSHQEAYAAIVAAQGCSEWLVQREFERFDHCTFTPEEEIQALLDVVEWVETGVPPTP